MAMLVVALTHALTAAQQLDFALPGSRPNILLYLMDDWPYEFWPGVSTSERGTPTNYSALLPALSRHLVDGGLQIGTTYVQPMSAPSRRSLFSGRFMTQVGRPFGQINSLSTRISTIGERLASAGCACSSANAPRPCARHVRRSTRGALGQLAALSHAPLNTRASSHRHRRPSHMLR
jgi:hypothetical protein